MCNAQTRADRTTTCNIAEAVAKFRQAGISTTEVRLGAGIEQGLYPFAICIHTESRSSGKPARCFEIYTKLLDEYLKERLLPETEEAAI